MVLELHIWGPAFSLPSIDPQCLAAVAYLAQFYQFVSHYALQPLYRFRWRCALIQAIEELPVLRDRSKTIGGFENIIHYLRERSDGQWDLDQHLSNQKDRADITAFSSFLTFQAQPLLDLSLYVASDNHTKTRTAYSSILQWPTQYFIPPQLRTLAQARTEHLGLSSLDLATLDEERRSSSRKAADLIPQSLRTSRPTVTGQVREKQSSARFKLDALVDATFKPLQQLLGKKKWMLSDERASSLDCLALGYLSLALVPDVPQSWLAEGLRGRHPNLCEYVEGGVREVFGGKVKVEDALPWSVRDQSATVEGHSETALPWRAPKQNIGSAGASILSSTLASIPFYKRNIVIAPTQPPHSTDAPPHTLASTLLPPLLASVGAAAAIAGYLLYSNLSTQETATRKLSDMGEAGAMFAGLTFGEPENEVRIPSTEGRVPIGVEMDVESVGEMRGFRE